MNIKFQSDDCSIKLTIDDIYGDDDRADAEFLIDLIKDYTDNEITSDNISYDADEPNLSRSMSITVRR